MEAMGTNSTIGDDVGPGVPLESHAAAVTDHERTYAQWIHLGGMLSSLVLNGGLSVPIPFILVLVLWLQRRDQSRFIDDHGKEALNFQITHVLFALVVLAAGFVTCSAGWFVGWPVLYVFTLVVGILASRAASEGRYYRYPMCFRFVK